MNHLTDRDLVDALDGRLPPAVAAHVRECATCRERIADFAETLVQARGADVPEPSPLFWDHLSRAHSRGHRPTIRRRRARGGWPGPCGRRSAALALVVAIVIAGLVRPAPQSHPEAVVATDDVRLRKDEALEAAWALTADLVGSGDAVPAHRGCGHCRAQAAPSWPRRT